jgi:hypothetical protein
MCQHGTHAIGTAYTREVVHACVKPKLYGTKFDTQVYTHVQTPAFS